MKHSIMSAMIFFGSWRAGAMTCGNNQVLISGLSGTVNGVTLQCVDTSHSGDGLESLFCDGVSPDDCLEAYHVTVFKDRTVAIFKNTDQDCNKGGKPVWEERYRGLCR